jgi:hypothetical protein
MADDTPRLAQTAGLKVDEETKVRLGMILLEKWQTGSSPADIVNAFLAALAPGNAGAVACACDTDHPLFKERGHHPHCPLYASPSNPQETVRYQTQLQNPDLDERALPQSQIDSVSSTYQTCEHGNHLETCTICLMWRSLPSNNRVGSEK